MHARVLLTGASQLLLAKKLVIAGLLLLLGACAPRVGATGEGAARRLEEARQSPLLLRAFLYQMPKGGDLHSHLSGAAYAETLISAGAARGVCVNTASNAVAPCGKGTRK